MPLNVKQNNSSKHGMFIVEIALITAILTVGAIILTSNVEKEKKLRACREVDSSRIELRSDGKISTDSISSLMSKYMEPCSTLIYCESSDMVNSWQDFKVIGYKGDTIPVGILTDSVLKISNIVSEGGEARDSILAKFKTLMLGKRLQENRFGPGTTRVNLILNQSGGIERIEKRSFSGTSNIGSQIDLRELNNKDSIAGARTPESILKVIRHNIGKFQAKYQEKLSVVPDLSGKISINFTIAPSGKIIAIKALSSKTGCPALDQEILNIAKEMEFESIPRGNVTVTYSFVLDKN